jgi:phenylacetic acid degradation operon negative regulatory protein
MCRDIYQLCWRQTEAHLMKMLETANGPLPRAAKRFQARFGGIIAGERTGGLTTNAHHLKS